MTLAGDILATLFLLAGTAPPAELTLGSVHIALGAPEDAVITRLTKEFAVRRIGGGWEVRSRDPNNVRVPLVAIGTRDGHVQAVHFGWGPGVTPTLERMSEQLVSALPADADCRVRSFTRPLEGGTTYILAFQCPSTTIEMGAGVWSTGNTAYIDVRLE